jgi:hypothetical protein
MAEHRAQWLILCLSRPGIDWFHPGGNDRHLAATHSGAETAPVIFVDCDDETAVRILIADNRSNDLSSWDFHALAELLDSIRTDQGSLDGTLYDHEEYDRLLSDLTNGYLIIASCMMIPRARRMSKSSSMEPKRT